MNKVILMGRLTRDPEVRYSQGERQMAIARYTLAVDRRGRNAIDKAKKQHANHCDFECCFFGGLKNFQFHFTITKKHRLIAVCVFLMM